MRAWITVLTMQLDQYAEHESKLAWSNLIRDSKSPSLHTTVRHISGGPTVTVECWKYISVNVEDNILFHKTVNGWSSVMTTPYFIEPRSVIKLDSYVEYHADLLLGQAGHDSWFSEIMQNAKDLLRVRFP
jgi:hypothetical protein